MAQEVWSREEFSRRLTAMGRYYHIHHPFHVRMNNGGCSKEEIRCWVANRFYYQTTIPIKDAAIMANCTDQLVRREWVQRILDHDGTCDEDSGLEAWLRLAEAVGLSAEEVRSFEHVLPGVRFACDAYLNFARRATWQEAACSSLTELFAPTIHQKRLDGWPQHYPWIETQGYDYFRQRLSQARRDVEFGLEVTLDHFTSARQQQQAVEILKFKLDILWTMLDAMQMATEFKQPPYFNCEI